MKQLVLLFVAGLLASPALALMAGNPPDSPEARVDANTADSPWAGVAAVQLGTGVYSGVAVSPRHVLTAAHVAGGGQAQAASLTVVFNAGASQGFAVEKVSVFPGYSFPYDDLALLTLQEPLPAHIPHHPVNDLPLLIGDTLLTLVGYGASGQGDRGVSQGGQADIKRRGENVLDSVTRQVDNSGRSSLFFHYDFDGPEGWGPLGGPTLGNARESSVAGGDSGSPAFTFAGTRPVVSGINNFATPLTSGRAQDYGFGQGGGGILLSDPRFIAWLLEASDGEIALASRLAAQDTWNYHLPAIAGFVVAGGVAGVLWRRRRRC